LQGEEVKILQGEEVKISLFTLSVPHGIAKSK